MSTRRQAALLFCLLMVCYSYVHQRPGWNQNTRLDLLHAICVQTTLKIDAYHENTGDKSIHDGHYYSDKAPGIVVLALPPFALCAGLLRVIDINIDSPEGWLISDWVTTALSVGLITSLGGAAMFLFLCKLVPRQYACLTVFAVFLGSAPFPYATMLFSHAAVIGLLCIALWAIADDEFLLRHLPNQFKIQNLKSKIDSPLNWRKRHLLAGLCCGFAIASEFPSAIAVGGVLVLGFFTSVKRGLLLAFATVPPLLLVPAYNWVCFGGPLSFGYHNLALTQFQAMNEGLFGITFPPKPGAAYLILLSPDRGLFFWTPFFLVAFLGLKPLWKSSRSLCWVCCILVVAQVIVISGYYMPSGGAALGPRHLAPIVPFITMAAAMGTGRQPLAGLLLGLYSILLTGLATTISAMPLEVPDSIFYRYLFRIRLGEFAENLGICVGLPVYVSIGLIIALMLMSLICAYALKLGQKHPGEVNVRLIE